MSERVSIIVPTRNEQYLSNTVDDLFNKATGDIEVIVVADGEWPDPPLENRDGLIIIHKGSQTGSRPNTNGAARIATGKYLMKCDAHCMFDRGFDEKLKAESEPKRLMIPSRYSLDVDNWKRGRGPVHYLYLTFPYTHDELYGFGFHGKKWKGPTGEDGSFWHLERERRKIKIDEIIIFQGSCWFMPKKLFFDIDCLDDVNYYFSQEAIELSFKVWLSGGQVVRNKKTWYAHFHKDKAHGGRGFRLSKRLMIQTKKYSADFWMNNRWPKQTRKLEWLINKFMPMAGWPEDWQNPKYAKEFSPE
jgi:glycosyltransferase involved in cell wall biosynthesis